MASWRQGTLKQYKTFLAKWELFCKNNKITPSQATTEDGIEFLTSLFKSGLGYSAVNTARSALSAVMKINDNISFGEHPLVCRFIKGVFQLKPALPKYTHIWDVEKVLSYLQTLAPVSSLDLKQLSLKLATFLAILTGQRCQTIHKLDLNLMQTLPDRYVFAIGEKLKHTRPGQHQEPIELTCKLKFDWNSISSPVRNEGVTCPPIGYLFTHPWALDPPSFLYPAVTRV